MSERPAYTVLADRLRETIRRREYGGDRRLPTEQELTEQHGLSRQTVRRAYLELVSEGLIERSPGRGTFVAERPPKYLRRFGSVEDLLDFSIDTDVHVTKPLARGTNIEAAARLGLDNSVVHSVEYLRMHRGVPFAWTTVSLPPSVADLLQGSIELSTLGGSYPITVIGMLEGRHSTVIAVADQTISAVAADARVAERLGCDPGSPILRIDRLFLDDRDQPVELSVGYFLPDQYTYRARLDRADS